MDLEFITSLTGGVLVGIVVANIICYGSDIYLTNFSNYSKKHEQKRDNSEPQIFKLSDYKDLDS